VTEDYQDGIWADIWPDPQNPEAIPSAIYGVRSDIVLGLRIVFKVPRPQWIRGRLVNVELTWMPMINGLGAIVDLSTDQERAIARVGAEFVEQAVEIYEQRCREAA